MPQGPPFGTASAYTDSFPSPPPRQLVVSAETCWNLGAFKDVIKQYRKLDDQIITRLNRAAAQMRDQSRLAGPSHLPEGRDAMCVKMWEEMASGWAHRQTLLTFCIKTVNESIGSRRSQTASPLEERLEASPVTNHAGDRQRGVKEQEVYADQLANEEYVEAIIRKRTLDGKLGSHSQQPEVQRGVVDGVAFKSRCPYFTPTASAGIGHRQWWDLVNGGRPGRGPDLA